MIHDELRRGDQISRNKTNDILTGSFLYIIGRSITMIKHIHSFGGMETLLIPGSELTVRLNQYLLSF